MRQSLGQFVHLSALRIVHCVRLKKLTTEEFAVCVRRSCSPVENETKARAGDLNLGIIYKLQSTGAVRHRENVREQRKRPRG